MRCKERTGMKNKGCGTCKELEEIDFCNKSFAESSGELTKVLKVQLVTKIYDRKGQMRGCMGYKAKVINFCPECGKKIEESKKKWRM